MIRDDFDLLVPAQGLSRRSFGRAALGVGFAAAVLPVVAETAIKTDTNGLIAGEVDIPVASFKMPAYRAAPAGKTQAPVVLVISEILGVHEYIADVALIQKHQGIGWQIINQGGWRLSRFCTG